MTNQITRYPYRGPSGIGVQLKAANDEVARLTKLVADDEAARAASRLKDNVRPADMRPHVVALARAKEYAAKVQEKFDNKA